MKKKIKNPENYMHLSNKPDLKIIRRRLRNNMTPSEIALWQLIKNKKLKGRKFRRQHSIGSYVLDFFCPEERLGIELDGDVHSGMEAESYDNKRERFLNDIGIKILRFENRMVFEMPESLLRIIEENFGWYNRIGSE